MIEMKGISMPNHIMENPEQTLRPPGLYFHRTTSYLTPYPISRGVDEWEQKSDVLYALHEVLLSLIEYKDLE